MPVRDAGVDTWSPCWYVDGQSAAGRALVELCTGASSRGRMMPQPVAGHRVGYVDGPGLLYAEGHPSTAVDEDGPLQPRRLPAALEGLTGSLLTAGVPVPAGVARWTGEPGHARPEWQGQLNLRQNADGFAGIRRLDATVDYEAPTAGEGLAVLAGVAAMAAVAPRSQAEVRFAKDGTGTVETVYMRGMGGVRVLARWYDKGLEAGTAPRGRLLRIEDQRRYPKGHRRDVWELAQGAYVRESFGQRFLPLWKASKGVTVAGYVRIADKLVEAVELEDLRPQAAERLAGFLLLSARGARPLGMSAATVRRRKAELRGMGLVVAQGALQEVEVDLHAVIDEALESDRWGSG